jgi:hypothetical protein
MDGGDLELAQSEEEFDMPCLPERTTAARFHAMIPAVAEDKPEVCLNCGEKLLGEFCWRCGQEAVDLRRPMRDLASDFLEDVLDLDSKLLRTIGPLLFRPGRLTLEYLAGRRAPYVRPLKLYLLAALVAFGVLAIWPQRVVRVTVGPPGPEPPAEARKPPTDFDRAIGKALADPRKFQETIAENMPRAFFLLLPIFAFLLKLLYLRRHILYLDHLVFALHFHAFAFAVMAVVIPLGAAGFPELLRVALQLSVFVYLFLALRAVYRDSLPMAWLRFAALLITYGAAFGAVMYGLMRFAVYRLGS